MGQALCVCSCCWPDRASPGLFTQSVGCVGSTQGAAQVALLHAIGNPSKPLRHTVGTNVAVIVGVGGLPTWPELLSSIVRCLESNDKDSLEGALDALYKVHPTAGHALGRLELQAPALHRQSGPAAWMGSQAQLEAPGSCSNGSQSAPGLLAHSHHKVEAGGARACA